MLFLDHVGLDQPVLSDFTPRKSFQILMDLASRDNTFVASYASLICHNNVHVAIFVIQGKENHFVKCY